VQPCQRTRTEGSSTKIIAGLSLIDSPMWDDSVDDGLQDETKREIIPFLSATDSLSYLCFARVLWILGVSLLIHTVPTIS
jgi:hypothetical protein